MLPLLLRRRRRVLRRGSSEGTLPTRYRVVVNGNQYEVDITPEGSVASMRSTGKAEVVTTVVQEPSDAGRPLPSPLTGTVFKLKVREGQAVNSGEVVLILEAMKMEAEVRADGAGTVVSILVHEGDAVQAGDALLYIA